MLNSLSLQDLKKIQKYQELVLSYYHLEIPEESQMKLDADIEKMTAIYFDEAMRSGILRNKQTLGGISYTKEFELINKLEKIQRGKYQVQESTKKFELKENTIFWDYSDQSTSYTMLFAFTNFTDLSTFKLVEYLYHHNHDGQASAESPKQIGELGNALVVMLDHIVIEPSLVF